MSINVFDPPIMGHNKSVFYTNLPGTSLTFVLSQAAKHSNGPLLLIADSVLEAQRWQEECRFFAPELPCLLFPAWETLPYDVFSPHQDIISERLRTLQQLPLLTKGIIISPISTLLQRLAPVDYLAGQVFLLAKGEKFSLVQMRERLVKAGYHAVSQVSLPGEYAVRGSIFDIFPTGSEQPYRIDLFDDEVDSIRGFDPETQRSSDQVDKIQLLPAHEFPLTEEGIKFFRGKWRETFSHNPNDCSVYQAVSHGESAPGLEYYLPLFFEKTASLFDYLPNATIIFSKEKLIACAESEWQEVRDRYEQRRHDISRPILTPVEIYLAIDELFGAIKKFSQLKLVAPESEKQAIDFAVQALPSIAAETHQVEPFRRLKNFIDEHSDARILFCAETSGRREALLEMLKPQNLMPKVVDSWQEFVGSSVELALVVANLEQGFILPPAEKLILIPEGALLGTHIVQARRRRAKDFDAELVIRNLTELTIGAPIVHVDHGVGRYQGLTTLEVGGVEAEFLKLTYEDSQLYVPVANLHLISRYSGGDVDHAPLHRLGSDQWQKAKRKAAEQVRDVAAELLTIYAKRAAREGFKYQCPQEQYQLFAAGFPFEETIDQERAIEAVMQDMVSAKPMDRLICGDVGFGKTEVAMRAAFLAVHSGKQVAILVPTTLLAQQHYENFCDRFANWPIKIDVMSRFRTAKQQQELLANLKNGNVDIVIGTHKLLQEDVVFHDLGLVIIDEEHRFGVRQKERLKSLRSEVDILTMTATPIPRTLNMAMSDLRDLSIIATPPARRLAVKTFVREFDWPLIREAIQREILRGGQVYFLHNMVETIENMAEELRKLVPEARIIVGHGQLHERDLERVMIDFHHQRFNVLVCSTIIETGIDIPNANTIIINRADKFGLAQLHQLRGRVGRSHHQAYAYLLTGASKALTADAKKRLEAIAALEDLGVGFMLATHDLEIRGAGELLGENQSGQMQAVGYSLYMEMLHRAVKALQEGKLPDFDMTAEADTEIDLQIPALIPENYVGDVNLRLTLYKRLSIAQDGEALKELRVEFIDRFGLLPPATQNLFDLMQLKLQAKGLGIKKIEASTQGGRIEFIEQPSIDPMKILMLIQLKPKQFKFDGPKRLKFFWQVETAKERLDKLTEILKGFL